jgi:hypothetical protein
MKVALVTQYWKESSGGGLKVYPDHLSGELRGGNEVSVIFNQGCDDGNYKFGGSALSQAAGIFSALIRARPDRKQGFRAATGAF